MAELKNAFLSKAILEHIKLDFVIEKRPGSGDYVRITGASLIRLVTDDNYNFEEAYDEEDNPVGKLVVQLY